MPLVQSTLASSLFDILSHPQSDISILSSDLAQAYFNYASQALGPNAEPLLIKGTESSLLREQFYLVSKGLLPAPIAAPGLVAGVVAFWLFPPVVSATGGVATSIAPMSLVKALAELTVFNEKTSLSAANKLAGIMHDMTSTVLMVETPPLISGFLI